MQQSIADVLFHEVTKAGHRLVDELHWGASPKEYSLEDNRHDGEEDKYPPEAVHNNGIDLLSESRFPSC